MTIEDKYAAAEEYRAWQRRSTTDGAPSEPLDWFHHLLAESNREFRLAVDELLAEDQEPEGVVRRLRELAEATR